MGSRRLTDDQLQELYTWVDQVPLSRPKRNITRDFSDGVLFAEMINHYHPNLVDLHNYSAANSLQQKTYNWETLQKKTLSKLKCPITPDEIDAVCACRPQQIEKILLRLKSKLAAYHSSSRNNNADDNERFPSGGGDRFTPVASSSKAAGFFKPHRDSERGESRGEDDGLSRSQDGGHGLSSFGMGHGHGADDKDRTILELRDTVSILELKISKLEQLLQLKDNKIAALQQQL